MDRLGITEMAMSLGICGLFLLPFLVIGAIVFYFKKYSKKK